MNCKWCTVAFWTESLKWLVFRLSSVCLRSAHLVQLCRVLCDDLLIPLSFSQPFPGQSPSLFCLALTQPCAHICLSTKAVSVLPWNHLHFFPPWAKVNRGIIFWLEATRTSRKWLRSLHSSSPSSSPQPISWEHKRGSGGRWSPSLSVSLRSLTQTFSTIQTDFCGAIFCENPLTLAFLKITLFSIHNSHCKWNSLALNALLSPWGPYF